MIFCDIFINTYNLFYFLEVEYNKYLQILATWYTYINDELSCMYKNTCISIVENHGCQWMSIELDTILKGM